jgi:thiosulfate dehydrogenase
VRSLILAAVLAGCDANGPVAAADYGEELFNDPGFSRSEFNSFSCATCHDTRPDSGSVRIGATLYDGAFRDSWWGGYAPRLIDAVGFCYVYFMRGEPLAPDDERGRALYEYLVRLSSAKPSPALPMTVVENVGIVPRGDPVRGETVYGAACRVCHGDPHTGRDRISYLASIIPETSVGFARQQFNPPIDPALVVVEKVRHGQFFGVGGNMPLFSREALSDDDLGAVLAYLGL